MDIPPQAQCSAYNLAGPTYPTSSLALNYDRLFSFRAGISGTGTYAGGSGISLGKYSSYSVGESVRDAGPLDGGVALGSLVYVATVARFVFEFRESTLCTWGHTGAALLAWLMRLVLKLDAAAVSIEKPPRCAGVRSSSSFRSVPWSSS